MNLAIWKYDLNGARTVLDLPRHAKVLHVAPQDGKVRLWALVNPALPTEKRTFFAAVTGEALSEGTGGAHLATILLNDGAFVLHYFEVPTP